MAQAEGGVAAYVRKREGEEEGTAMIEWLIDRLTMLGLWVMVLLVVGLGMKLIKFNGFLSVGVAVLVFVLMYCVIFRLDREEHDDLH